MKEPIRKITLADGTVRYRLVVDIGKDQTGKRKQLTRTYARQKDARAELSRIRHQQDAGTYVQPSKMTLNQYLDDYLVGATRDRRESTKANYRHALKPVRAPGGPDTAKHHQGRHRATRGLDAHRGPQAFRQAGDGARPALGPAHPRQAQGGFRNGR